MLSQQGDSPSQTGDKPSQTGDKPSQTGDKPFQQGDSFSQTGDKPFQTLPGLHDCPDNPAQSLQKRLHTHPRPLLSAPMPQNPRTLIVMGVCGCGKSLIGSLLARKLGGVFEDADDFHLPENKDKMRAGIPLTDADRWPWLRALRARIEEMRGQTPCYVLACSALKQVYRDILRGGDARADLEFVFLSGTRETILTRMAARQGHYMPTTLLDSQFAILEAPGEGEALVVDIGRNPDNIVAQVLAQLGARVDTRNGMATLLHEQAAAAPRSEDHRRAGSLGEAAQALLGAGAGAGGGIEALQVERLVEWAEKNGCLIPDVEWTALPLVSSSTSEHEVRHCAEDQRAWKRTWPGTFGFIPRFDAAGWMPRPATPLEYLQRFEIQNLIFGDAVQVEGVMISPEPSLVIGVGAGGVSLVVSQPWLDAADEKQPHPTADEVAEVMRSAGFEAVPGAFFGWLRREDGILVLDARPDNFIKTVRGVLPIDLHLTRLPGQLA